ncbi:unnamed protein product [Mytilus coruscus]|uniref:Uncharacterized protein n=1 Tax=Mytilus coruscus TaxID=42192 RepID=A0A6J7ZRQ0_MYTCO|nr:unnamed protein product [Mytilus coruscus]
MATEKKFRISSVEYDKPTISKNIDWANCILCQEITDEKVICPFDSKRLNVGAGYQTLANNIKKFHELRLMPEAIYVCIENCQIYVNFIRKECLGEDVSSRVNSSRLKDRIVSHFPDLNANKQGRENILAFKDDIGPALKKVCLENFDNEFVNISKAATFVRKDIFSLSSEFKGTFPQECQEVSVPQSLLSLVSMFQFGPNIQDRSYSQSTLTKAQLLMYGCTKKQSNRHMKDHEPQVCAYEGIMVHCKTRKCDLVDTFFKLGLSVSYDRVLEISTSMANDACRRYIQEGIVCPTNLLQNIFTSSAVDNIDHNISSISSRDSFHGTCISLFQNISEDVQGVLQTYDQSEAMLKCHSKRVSLLPESYSNLPPAVLRFSEPDIPLVE